jgi:tetratricopeptide (TPR) repeat protein
MPARRTVLRWSAPFAALLAFGAARAARAEDARSDARAHYARGLELAGQRGYEGALREFEAAYAISPQYAVLYNIGQAHVALGQTREAIDALARYLRDGGDRVSPERRVQVERQLTRLRSALPNAHAPAGDETEQAAAAGAEAGEAIAAASENAHLVVNRTGTLTVRCGEPGLKLTLDGKHVDPVVSARGFAVPTGPHRLALTLPGRRPTEQTVAVSDGTSTVVVCENLIPTLGAGPAPALGPPVFSDLTASGANPTIRARTVAYLLGGIGLALGGAAAGVYVWNRGQASTARTEYAQLNSTDLPHYYDQVTAYNQQVDNVHRASELTIGLVVTSVGLLAGSVYLWLRDHHRDRPNAGGGGRSQAALGPGGVVWGGAW